MLKVSQSQSIYKCDIFGKIFSDLGCLNIHKEFHTCEILYKCSTCGEVFRQSNNLDTHMKTHEIGLKRIISNDNAPGKKINENEN